MSITKVPPPRTLRQRRILSETDIVQLAELVRNGDWASDGQPVKTKNSKGAAYQRAQTAAKILDQRYELKVTTSVFLVDDNDPEAGYFWSVGPVDVSQPELDLEPTQVRPSRHGTSSSPEDLVRELELEQVMAEESGLPESDWS